MLPITRTHCLQILMFILPKRAFLSNHKTLKFSFTIIIKEPVLGHLCLIKCNGGDHTLCSLFFYINGEETRDVLHYTVRTINIISFRFVSTSNCLCECACLLCVVCVCLCMLVSNTYCVFLRLVYPMLPVSLDCPFLIVPSVFSNIYSYIHTCL